MLFDKSIILCLNRYFIFLILSLLQVECYPRSSGNIKSLTDAERNFQNWINDVPCNGSTLCENVTKKEQELINNAVSQKSFKFQGIVDRLRTNITGKVRDSTNMCDYEEKLIYPKKALNGDNNWLIVLNNEKYVQRIYVNICLNKNDTCKYTSPNSKTKTWCQQDYIERHLVAMMPNGKISTEVFPIPAGCCCHGSWT